MRSNEQDCTLSALHLNSLGGRKRKADQQAAILAAHSNTANQALYGAPATSFVPSNEPLYCTCRRPYVGQMVACENEDCEVRVVMMLGWRFCAHVGSDDEKMLRR